MKHPNWLVFILLVTTALLLGSCVWPSARSGQNRHALKAESGPVTLNFWHTHNDDETKSLQDLLRAFQQQYPHITVNLQYVPFSDALNKYKTVAQAGNAPDIFRAEIAWTADLASMGYLLGLDALLSEAERRDYIPQALAYNQYKGHLWGVPQVTDCLALLYNRQYLKGHKLPQSANELVQLGKQLTHIDKKDPQKNKYGFFLMGNPYWYVPFIWGFGGELIVNGQVKIAEPPAVKALEFLVGLRTQSKIVPNEVDFSNGYENQQIGFKSGKYAMILNGPWATADILAGDAFKNPAHLGIAKIPGTEGRYGSPVGGHNYVIASTTPYALAAWSLVQFLNRPENQAQLALKNNLLPSRRSTYELPAVKKNRIIQDFRVVLESANIRPVLPQSGALFLDLTPAYQAVLLQEKSPEQALKEVEAAWRKLLQEE